MDFIAWYKSPGWGTLSFTEGETVHFIKGLDSYAHKMSPAGIGFCPDVQGICMGERNVRACAGFGRCAWSLEGFSLDPQSKWISRRDLVWAHASFMCYIWPHPSRQVLKKAIGTCFSSGQSSLAHVVGGKLKGGQRSILETRGGVESLTTFLQVFWILLSTGTSSLNRQVSSYWDKTTTQARARVNINHPLSTEHWLWAMHCAKHSHLILTTIPVR